MAHRRYHRLARPEDGPCDHLFIERPQVLQRSAATPDNDHIDVLQVVQNLNRPGNLCRSSCPLHPGWRKQYVQILISSLEHPQDILNSGTRR